MADINKIFELHRQSDELRRSKGMIDRVAETSLSPFNHQRQLINEIVQNRFDESERSFSTLSHLRLAENSVKQTLLENLSGFQDANFQNAKKTIVEVFHPFSESKLLSERIKNNFEQLRESLISPFQSQHSELLKSLEQLTRATTFSGFEMLSKAILEKSSLAESQNLLSQISTSLLSYDNFTNRALAQLKLNIDKSISLALKGSLTIANEQVLRLTSSAQSYIENFDISHFDTSNLFFDGKFPRINRYHIQKQELLRRDDIEEDEEYESLVIKSPSAISFEQITNCMTLIGLCNEASETTKGNTIFTLTSTLWLSAWKLIDVIPTNKDNFAVIVDCLYLMLYEGAGKDKLRFIEQGYINVDEAELIWKIKHLRNKWLRHDISHGKEPDIKKSHQHRKEALEWFGLEKVPYSKDEFVFLYNNLILKVEEFLILLLERVSKFTN